MTEHVPPAVLSALVDGECDPDERRAVHEHLLDCGACRTLTKEFAAVRGLVAGLERLSAPESLVRSVLEPGRTTMLRTALRGPRKYVAAGLGAAALVVSLAGIAAPPEQRQPPVEVFMTRHASLTAGNTAADVIFAVTGR